MRGEENEARVAGRGMEGKEEGWVDEGTKREGGKEREEV